MASRTTSGRSVVSPAELGKMINELSEVIDYQPGIAADLIKAAIEQGNIIVAHPEHADEPQKD